MQTRRSFVRAGAGAAAIGVLAPAASVANGTGGSGPRLFRGGRFAQGVLSGEPGPGSITLATLLDDVGGRGAVRLEVAEDRGFRRVVAARTLSTSRRTNFSVKARVTGLDPLTRYYYRFETRDRSSPVGRFRTALPADSRQPVKFAFFSCAEWGHGYYNAYELLADEDVDFVVNLGDYIYAESDADGGDVRSDPTGREIAGARSAVTLGDYRAKYALYRCDASLRAVHARHPMISVWDDHEVANNYAGGAPDGGLPPDHRVDSRKRAAYQAFFEAMPVFASGRSRIYRSLRFGRNVDLIMLDERQYRADQPCGDAIAAPGCAEQRAPRPFLGTRQLAFFKERLSSSRATWKLIGNQVPIMPLKVSADRYGVFDTWQGYLAEREDVISHIRDRGIGGVVFCTGDFHTFFAGDVRPGESASVADTVATEFHSGSITSRSLGEGQAGVLPGADDNNPNTPAAIYDLFRSVNPWIDAADIDHHGYGIATASSEELTVRYRRLATIKRRSTETLDDIVWTVRPDAPSIKGQIGPG